VMIYRYSMMRKFYYCYFIEGNATGNMEFRASTGLAS
jgi:hypothetical protein